MPAPEPPRPASEPASDPGPRTLRVPPIWPGRAPGGVRPRRDEAEDGARSSADTMDEPDRVMLLDERQCALLRVLRHLGRERVELCAQAPAQQFFVRIALLGFGRLHGLKLVEQRAALAVLEPNQPARAAAV